jgi:hypothetical protein
MQRAQKKLGTNAEGWMDILKTIWRLRSQEPVNGRLDRRDYGQKSPLTVMSMRRQA